MSGFGGSAAPFTHIRGVPPAAARPGRPSRDGPFRAYFISQPEQGCAAGDAGVKSGRLSLLMGAGERPFGTVLAGDALCSGVGWALHSPSARTLIGVASSARSRFRRRESQDGCRRRASRTVSPAISVRDCCSFFATTLRDLAATLSPAPLVPCGKSMPNNRHLTSCGGRSDCLCRRNNHRRIGVMDGRGPE